MNGAIGRAAIVVGLIASIAGAATIIAAIVTRRPRLARLCVRYVAFVCASAVVAFAVMERALITRDFSLAYVAQVGSRSTPRLFNVAALWSALEGSILLWVLILASFIVAVTVKFRHRLDDPLVGWALAVMLTVAAFFFMLMIGPANPFRAVVGPIPTDGPGPNPLLQNHILMAFHPPMLYLGYVGFTVPFAFAIASLITGRVGEGWLVQTRRWTLFAWGFLTIGVILGGWWSYEVLGWGGYWGWDPVENASLLPWLTGTAYLHSVMIQERRGMLRVWNLTLLCATFSLTILGTFLTRSGVLQSVHAFSNSGIGPLLIGFFAVCAIGSIALIGWRADRLRSPGSIDSPVSREGAFLVNNLLFAAFAFVVLLGTVFPLLLEAINGQRVSVGAPYFNQMAIPLGVALLTLMAVAPVLPWRKASLALLQERLLPPAMVAAAVMIIAVTVGARGPLPVTVFGLGGFAAGAAGRQLALATRRNGWRGLVGHANGGMIVHLGVVLIAVTLAASGSYSTRAEFTLAPGQQARLAGHTITYLGTRQITEPQRTSTVLDIQVDDAGIYRPALQQYRNASTPIGTPSVRSGPIDDVYLTVLNAPTTPDMPARIGMLIMPFTLWLWVGGGVIAVGTLLAAWPGQRRRPTDPTSAPASRRLVSISERREAALK
jgi:cytochrome c-type biogenesis protein CcmF